jgi:succinyl-diaminopimelate desuccinylase
MDAPSRLAELALSLVDVPSVSGGEQAITSWIADFVEREAPGCQIRHVQPDAIVFGPPGPPDVALAGHSDTVPVQDNLPGRLDGDLVQGLGASDMKGSLAVMLALAAELGSRPSGLRPLFVVFGREELPIEESVLPGLFDACPAIRHARLTLMMEPTDNRIEAGCQGNIKAGLVFRGVAAHSARPWLGVNAISEAVRGLRPLTDAPPLDVVLDGLTFREVASVTEIHGGIANNVIPDLVTCGLNFRYAGNRSREEAEARLRELIGPAGELTVHSNAPGAPVNLDNPLLGRLRKLGGLEVRPKQAWTPVAEFAMRGLDAVNFGPGDPAHAHTREERVAVAALVDAYRTIERFACG